MLDDWGSIAKFALPLIIEHGPKAVQWLWDKFSPKLRELAGMDVGLWEGDYNSNPTKPSKTAYWPGVNVNGPNFAHKPKLQKASDVSVDYACSFICPERY